MLGCRAQQIDHSLSLNMNNQYMFQLGNNFHNPFLLQKKPVGVFWDIENCAIPRGLNIYSLVAKIRTLFENFNLIEREFAVVCDVFGLGHNVCGELNDMQLDIVHVCSYSKNASDEKLKQMIYRFVMVHGQYSAIILLSSDINFAPLLSDIRNRIGASVILFHHRQVSPALVACAHHNIDFDNFCSQIPITASLETDSIVTYLTISNWPRFFTEDNTRSFLNRITGNCGGRVLQVDFRNCEANIIFKCRSDAQRCLQRVNNRRMHGNTLRARINPIPFILPAPAQLVPIRPVRQAANQPTPAESRMVEMPFQSPVVAAVAPVTQPEDAEYTASYSGTASLLKKLKANRCQMCTHGSDKISRYTNHLFQQQILNVHISLTALSEGINCLFQSHDGKIPLNSLPNCWLAAFGEELDTTTEPKVMLEHLLACLSNVAFVYADVAIKDERIAVKFIVKSTGKLKPTKKLSKKRRTRLANLAPRLHTLIVGNMASSLTSFPSLLLSSLPAKYEEVFRETLKVDSFGVGSLAELISLLASRYNLYSYDDDFLVSLNLEGNLHCFALDMYRAVSSLSSSDQTILSDSDVNMDVLRKIFKKYFKTELNEAVYGVCFIEDLIDQQHRGTFDGEEVIISDRLPGVEEEAKIEIVDLEKCIPLVQQLLQSLSNWRIEMNLFYRDYQAYLQAQVNLSPTCSYPEFVKLFSSMDTRRFIVETDGNRQWLVLSPKLQQLELIKRLLQVFYLLSLMGDRHDADCHCMISFPIDHIFAQYRRHFNAHSSRHDLCSASLPKVFERALTRLYQSQVHQPSLFLVYTPNDVFLQECNSHWVDEHVIRLFAILFESPSYSLTWQQLNRQYRDKHHFTLGPSCLAHGRFREVICLEKDESNQKHCVKLSPVYEFAAMCMTVMLLHSDAMRGVEWSIEQLKVEYYDHFGITIATPASFDSVNYKSLFERIDILFAVVTDGDIPFELRVAIKQPDLLQNISSERIPTCNYCEKSIIRSAESEDKVQSGGSGNSSETALSDYVKPVTRFFCPLKL